MIRMALFSGHPKNVQKRMAKPAMDVAKKSAEVPMSA